MLILQNMDWTQLERGVRDPESAPWGLRSEYFAHNNVLNSVNVKMMLIVLVLLTRPPPEGPDFRQNGEETTTASMKRRQAPHNGCVASFISRGKTHVGASFLALAGRYRLKLYALNWKEANNLHD